MGPPPASSRRLDGLVRERTLGRDGVMDPNDQRGRVAALDRCVGRVTGNSFDLATGGTTVARKDVFSKLVCCVRGGTRRRPAVSRRPP
jgi:hypothetical protein